MSASFISQGAGPTIVFLHGVGSGKEGFSNQIDPVVSNGWHFLSIDAPGFGETPFPAESGFEPHVDAVVGTLDDLEIKTAIICGHSLGGMTAQEIAARHPDRVSGLILSATSPAFGKPGGDFQKKFLRDRFSPFEHGMTMPEFANSFSPKLVGSNPAPGAIEAIIEVMSSVSIDTYRRAMQTITTFDQRANLPNITAPTLLIAGEFDTNAPAPMMQKMASKIDGSIFVELSNTGHMAPIENPDEFNRHLVNFIKRAATT